MKSTLVSCGKSNSLPSLALLALASLALTLQAHAQLVRISVDNLTNTDSIHRTEVEPDTFAWGNTIVSAFHVARRPGTIGWGSGDVGFSTSTNGGVTWTHGDLPGLTVNYKGGTYGAAADPSVCLLAVCPSGAFLPRRSVSPPDATGARRCCLPGCGRDTGFP